MNHTNIATIARQSISKFYNSVSIGILIKITSSNTNIVLTFVKYD